jgi:hypothetical protein
VDQRLVLSSGRLEGAAPGAADGSAVVTLRCDYGGTSGANSSFRFLARLNITYFNRYFPLFLPTPTCGSVLLRAKTGN